MSALPTAANHNSSHSRSIAAVLSHFARRRTRLLALRAVCAGVIALLISMSIVALADHGWLLHDGVRWLLSCVAYGVTIVVLIRYGWQRGDRQDNRRIARQLETAAPGLHQQVLATVELTDPRWANGSPQFRQSLAKQTSHRLALLDVDHLLPVALIRPWLWTAALMLLTTGLLMTVPKLQIARRIGRVMLPAVAIQRASLTKIYLTAPAPPSGSVVAGNAVGVVAKIENMATNDARLQWRSSDGRTEQLPMSRRGESDEYAAILHVHDQQIEYRIVAGDAITLWHRLTPVPRPRVQQFTKRYVFPAYTGLPDQTVVQEHGNLAAIVGTVAHVTVDFDQSCRAASLQIAGRSAWQSLQPVGESDSQFAFSMPINSSERYSISGTAEPNMANDSPGVPFRITPILDTPPKVHWDHADEGPRIVSMFDTITLRAAIADEFPVETVYQQYQINDGPPRQQGRSAPDSPAAFQLEWEWDLFAAPTDSLPDGLAGGDLIRTQLVAIDRKGQRGESSWIEILVADDGFAADRFSKFDPLHDAVQHVIEWRDLMTRRWQGDSTPSSDALHSGLLNLLANADTAADAGRVELIFSAVANLESKLLPHESAAAMRLSNQARQIETYARNYLAHRLSLQWIDDSRRIAEFATRLKQPGISQQRLQRQLQILNSRLGEIDQSIAHFSDALPESIRQSTEQWRQWHTRQRERIERAIDGQATITEGTSLLSAIATELNDPRTEAWLLNRQTSLDLISGLKAIRQQLTPIDQRIRNLSIDQTDLTLAALAQAKQLQIRHPLADLSFLADLNLLSRGIEQIAANAAESVNQEPVAISLGDLADAVAILSAGHELILWRGELRGLLAAEGDPISGAGYRFEYPQWLDRYRAGLEMTRDNIADSTLIDADSRLRQPIHKRSADKLQRAAELLSARRFEPDKRVSARVPLRAVDSELSEYIEQLQPLMQQARAVLRRYAAPLHQLAQAAAAQVQRASDELRDSQEAPDSQQTPPGDEPTSDLQAIQDQADAMTQLTMEALADLANTLATADSQSRELARDADSALSQIAAARERVNDSRQASNESAELGQALKRLQARLEQAAAHFERADAGQDLAESRRQLRASESDSEIAQQLDARSQRAAELADAAQQDAEELRKQLAQEAQQDDQMQDAMSEIARQTVSQARAALQQSAADELALRQSLERADAALTEAKIQLGVQASILAEQILAWEPIFLSNIDQAIASTSLGEQSQLIQQLRKTLRQAAESVKQINRPDDLQSSLAHASKEAAAEIRSATATLDQVEQSIAPPPGNINMAERLQRESRDLQLRTNNAQLQRWQNVKRDAQQRARQAREHWRASQELIANLQTTNSADDEPIVDQIAQLQQRIEQAQVREQAAEESVLAAEQYSKQREAQIDRLRKNKLAPFESDSVGIEVVRRLIAGLRDELAAAAAEVQQIASETDSGPALQVTPLAAREMQVTQQRIRDEIDATGNELRRAALQEQRLTRIDAAEKIAAAATRVKHIASSEATTAGIELARIEQHPPAAELANAALAHTINSLEIEIGQLAMMLGQWSPPPGDQSPAENGRQRTAADEPSDRAQQLAQTLDELDQAAAQERETSSQPSASQASPTLQAALEQSSRQAAQQRQQQINAGDPTANPSNRPSSGDSKSDQAGGSALGESGSVSIDGIDRLGAEWGQLRARRPDAASTPQRSVVPDRYRQHIEAYFRAIAERASGEER